MFRILHINLDFQMKCVGKIAFWRRWDPIETWRNLIITCQFISISHFRVNKSCIVNTVRPEYYQIAWSFINLCLETVHILRWQTIRVQLTSWSSDHTVTCRLAVGGRSLNQFIRENKVLRTRYGITHLYIYISMELGSFVWGT